MYIKYRDSNKQYYIEPLNLQNEMWIEKDENHDQWYYRFTNQHRISFAEEEVLDSWWAEKFINAIVEAGNQYIVVFDVDHWCKQGGCKEYRKIHNGY